MSTKAGKSDKRKNTGGAQSATRRRANKTGAATRAWNKKCGR